MTNVLVKVGVHQRNYCLKLAEGVDYTEVKVEGHGGKRLCEPNYRSHFA